jgi:hypothetical protein
MTAPDPDPSVYLSSRRVVSRSQCLYRRVARGRRVEIAIRKALDAVLSAARAMSAARDGRSPPVPPRPQVHRGSLPQVFDEPRAGDKRRDLTV